MPDAETNELFKAASRALNKLIAGKQYGKKTRFHLEASLDKLHAAYGSELLAGFRPDQQGDDDGKA